MIEREKAVKESFKKELLSVSETMDRIIAEDTFPDSIEPQNLRRAVRSYPMRGGKRIRPAILLWSCGALGGDEMKAVYAAASVEIYHNWTLVHDDIIDCDDLRRGLPSTHAELKMWGKEQFSIDGKTAEKYGNDFAILAGDVQQGWAMNMLMRCAESGVPETLLVPLMRRYQESVNRELISGEAIDVEFPLRDTASVTRDEVMKMMTGKTSALLRFATQCGGAIALNHADFNSAPLAALGSYADNLGLAFQLRDDYLDVFGTEKEFGKPICSDFHESKPTLLYLEAMHRLSGSGKDVELRALMGLPHYGEAEQTRIRALLSDSGAAESILNEAKNLAEKAKQSLSILPQNKYTVLFEDLLDYLFSKH